MPPHPQPHAREGIGLALYLNNGELWGDRAPGEMELGCVWRWGGAGEMITGRGGSKGRGGHTSI